MLEPEDDDLSSSHPDNMDEEVLDDVMKVSEEDKEGGAKGEDWDEVSTVFEARYTHMVTSTARNEHYRLVLFVNWSVMSSAVSQVSSQTSSVSSCDDYIIVLPDCFDTSRPLGESMYSSAMSQPDAVAVTVPPADKQLQQETEEDAADTGPAPQAETQQQQQPEATAPEDTPATLWPPPAPPIHSSVNQLLCASQTLDAVTLTPEVVPPLLMPNPLLPMPTLYSPRSELKSVLFPCIRQWECSSDLVRRTIR